MNELDYAILALATISIVVGVVRGAIREVINFAGWILAFVLAHAFAHELAVYFADWMAEPIYRIVMAWMSIFLLVLVLAALLASLVTGLVSRMGLGGLNRIFGAVIGLLRGVLVLLVLTLAAGMTKFPQSALWKNALATPWLEVAALHARALLPEGLASRISYRLPTLRQASAWQRA